MNKTLIFSVVIPTYHRNDSLAKCLDCLAPKVQTLSAEQYEVIVTDDGSETTAQNMIEEKYFWVKWVEGKHRGPAANRNNGAKFAKGKWLAFTDDDCLPDPRWLEAYAEAITNKPDYQVFEGRTYADRPRKSLAEESPLNNTGGYLWSCNFAIQKQLYESINGFDERFYYAAMEDVDLNYRLRKLGYKSLFITTASLCHPWKSIGGWKKLKQRQKSTFIYLSIHPEESERINRVYYLKAFFKRFYESIAKDLYQYKGSGIFTSLIIQYLLLENIFLVNRRS